VSKKVPLNGIEVCFRDEGNPKGPPIVLVHAYPMNHRMWESQIPALITDFRVICYDARGMGQTEPGPFPFAFDTLVDDLVALMDHLKIPQAVLCGLSMGGYIALRTVIRNPERVCGLILCDTQSLADQNIGRLHRHEALQTMQKISLPEWTEGFAKKVLADETFEKQPKVVELLKDIVNSHSVLAVSRLTLALVSRLDTTEGLPKISVPTLVMTGEHDKLIPPEVTRSLKEKIPGAELAIITKAGHMSNMENPEEFNFHMLRFMKKSFRDIH
jgi:pimeloyl-ACP methyl ester carboxylesterase